MRSVRRFRVANGTKQEIHVSSVKCSKCGLVNWAGASSCNRCNAPLTEVKDNEQSAVAGANITHNALNRADAALRESTGTVFGEMPSEGIPILILTGYRQIQAPALRVLADRAA